MAKKTTSKSTPGGAQNVRVTLPLDGKTGMFLAQLIQKGLAKPNIDESVPEGEVQASIESSQGKHNIVLHMKAAFFIVGGGQE